MRLITEVYWKSYSDQAVADTIGANLKECKELLRRLQPQTAWFDSIRKDVETLSRDFTSGKRNVLLAKKIFGALYYGRKSISQFERQRAALEFAFYPAFKGIYELQCRADRAAGRTPKHLAEYRLS